MLTGNSATWVGGGGAYGGTLNNCTLTGNWANRDGGGAHSSALNNCIVYYNYATSSGDNYIDSALNYCCTTPLPSGGVGNLSAEPQLASTSHLSADSPCRAAGSAAYATGTDIDGETWATPPSIGCDEPVTGSLTGELGVAITAFHTNVAIGSPVDFHAVIDGRAGGSQWDFGDSVLVSNRPCVTHAWAESGDYLVGLRAYNDSHPEGVLATVTVHVATPVHYVAVGSVNPVAPYSSWATAATTIQDAIDASVAPGALVLVSNGVYEVEGRVQYGISNRVVVTKQLRVESVNGPEVTAIVGYQVPGTTNGDFAMRCVYLTNGAVLSGFTLTQGATQTSGDAVRQQSGGGVWCESTRSVVTNCVLTGNAGYYGGGAYSGTLNNCTLTGNSAYLFGGGAHSSTLSNCLLTSNSSNPGGGGGTAGGTLNNCTLKDNWAAWIGGGAGGGVLNNCVLTGNSAGYGGGAHGATLWNCTFTGNSALHGGGAQDGVLNNCELTGNSADAGGGAYGGTLNNCTLTGNCAVQDGCGAHSGTLNNSIVYYNGSNAWADNYVDCTLNYCCTTPLPSSGVGNLTAEPQLASTSHLSAGSPCRGAGSADYATGTDVDGEPWASLPSIGCDEPVTGSLTGELSVAITASYTNVAIGFPVGFVAVLGGRAGGSRWDFGDGVVVSNRPYATHAYAEAGDYVVELRGHNESHPEGVLATVTVHVTAPVHYVAVGSVNPVAPYSSWATAAANIQDAVDASALPGSLVLVSNGVYQVGGRELYGLSNRVAVTKPVRLQSINGPEVTTIVGYQVPGTTNGDGAVRCVYLTDGAVLSGFTLTQGATQGWNEDGRKDSGGGVWCESVRVLVTNCVLTGNAAYYGGGAYGATLNNCTLTDNLADTGGGACSGRLENCVLTGNCASEGGGARDGALNNCVLTGNSANSGGGVYGGTLNHCTLAANSASGVGGGARDGVLNHCVLTGNSAGGGGGARGGLLNNCTLRRNRAVGGGGGAYAATLNNCELTANSADTGGGAQNATLNNCTLMGNLASRYGGGACDGTLNNCVVYYNNTVSSSGENHVYSTLNYCCTTPLPSSGVGNLSAEPQLASTSHLSADSPCRGAGSAAYATGTDIDGEPWANPPSIGCDEHLTGSLTGDLSVEIMTYHTNVAVGFPADFIAVIGGRAGGSRWDFGDGVAVSNRACATHAWPEAGDYVVELWAYNESHPEGVSATVTVHVATPVHYVAVGSVNPVAPYSSWATAAANIQDAVEASSVPGALVFVSSGVYEVGGREVYGMSNRVAVTKPVRVQSVNGP